MSSQASERLEIAAIPKGDRAEIRIAIDRMGVRRVIDVRLWFRPPHFADDQPMIPTKRGITTTPENARAIADAINTAIDTL